MPSFRHCLLRGDIFVNKIRSPPDYLQPKNTMEEDKMENDYKRNYF